MENGLVLPDSDNFSSKWEDVVEYKKEAHPKVCSFSKTILYLIWMITTKINHYPFLIILRGSEQYL